MHLLTSLVAIASIACLLTTQSGELPRVEPPEVKLSAEKLAKLKPALQKLVDDGKIAGAVALIARHGKVAYVDVDSAIATWRARRP